MANSNVAKHEYVYQGKQGIYYFCGITSDIIRCMYVKTQEELGKKDSSLLIDPSSKEITHPLQTQLTQDTLTISTGSLQLTINRTTEAFTWQFNGKLLLQEPAKELYDTQVQRYSIDGDKPIVERVKTVDGERSFIKNLKAYNDRTAYRAKIHFEWQPDEHIYGLGQGEEGIYNYRGHNQYLYQHNMRIPVPFLLSSVGYGLLADCTSLMTFNDDHNGSYLFLDTVDKLDYYMIAGQNTDKIIAGYRTLTGRAAMLPKWAFGYVQSKEAYKTADELLDVVKEYRKRNVPLDCIVQDWNTWAPGLWGDKNVDEARYGNLAEVMDEIHKQNVHTMVSVWPNMAEGGENHTAFMQNNQLLNDYSTYDAFNEDARKLYWQQCKKGLFDKGFDSWWCDSTEPFSGPDWGGEYKREPWERYALIGNEHKHYLDPANANAFALVHSQGIYENQRKDAPQKRVLNLTRSGYASQQRYGVVLWSGDIYASWETLQQQIAEGLNMCMSGLPYWTLDIGAFFTVGSAWQNRGCGNNDNPNLLWFWQGKYNEGVKDKGYCELYTRWFQFGTFLPMQRSHGTDTPREIWNFGEKGTPYYDAIEKYIQMRYTLMPYIYSLAGWTTQNHYTILRSLVFDFAHDSKALDIGQGFMFGPILLVYPVTKPMYYEAESEPIERAKTWDCYLPKGTAWYNYWTKEQYEGGQTVTVNAPLDIMPLFVKAGAILPQTPGIQYASQTPAAPITLEVFPGADGTFTLYSDSGDGYGYENGEFCQIPISWDEQAQQLQLGNQTGSYPGMPAQVQFKVSVFQKEPVLITYTGAQQTIQF